jgi:uncharacterized membrane protein
MKRIYDLLNAIFLALTTYTVLSNYSALPDRIPVHFGISGTPDRWGPKSEILIFVAIPWGLTIIFYLLTLAIPRFAHDPRYLNIPDKQAFLKLSAEKQAIFWNLLQEFMTAMTVCINFIFYIIAHGTLRVIQSKATSLPLRDVWAGLAVLGLVTIIYLPRMFTLPKKLVRGDGY